VHNAVSVAEIAVEKGATMLLIPISARRQLNELSDEMAMKLTILYYADAREALIKALGYPMICIQNATAPEAGASRAAFPDILADVRRDYKGEALLGEDLIIIVV
jgi:hypothetical protein